jgi:Ca-activated chloride channel family protein
MKKRWAVVSIGTPAVAALAVLMAACTHTAGPKEEPLPTVTPAQRKDPAPPEIPPLSPPTAVSPSDRQRTDDAAGEATLPAAVAEKPLGFEDGVPGSVDTESPAAVVGGIIEGLAAAPPPAAAPLRLAESRALHRKRERDFGGLSPRARYVGPKNTEAYDRIRDNEFLAAATNPLSTFSIDVDTASYANVRRFLESGQLPPKDAVRIEELINYFRYDYDPPEAETPFSVATEVFACPWVPAHRLVSIGLQGRVLEETAIPPRNLVFLLDVSGSMDDPRKLPLLKAAMKLLVRQLRAEDRVAIVVYAGSSGLVLPPTPGDRKPRLREALERLRAGGSTAGGEGIQLAYQVAAESFIPGGVNRVVLATDGDFNVGITNQGDLVRLIEEKRKTGVFLSVLGFGEGNLKDSTMEKLADSGNGNYAYIDSLSEARKVLVRESGATLVTIAKDVKIQVEFNPARVLAYRLIGYENRVLAAEDFNDDTKDAGEIGAGHSVTALYELVPVGAETALRGVDPLKYQAPRPTREGAASRELLTVKLRYKEPDGDESRLLSVAVDGDPGHPASANARFASAVAGFGMLLRDSEHKGQATWEQVAELGRGAVGRDPGGYRSQFCELVETAEALSAPTQISTVE